MKPTQHEQPQLPDSLEDFLSWVNSDTTSESVNAAADLHIGVCQGYLDGRLLWGALFEDGSEADNPEVEVGTCTALLVAGIIGQIQTVRSELPQLLAEYAKYRAAGGE